jgi:hypothetical protein
MTARAAAVRPVEPPPPSRRGNDAYDALPTAAAWQRLLFREPPTSGWQYDSDDDGNNE